MSVSIAVVAASLPIAAGSATAQAAPPTNLVSACSGVSLPRSVVTDIITPVVNGIVTPVQGTVNPILGVVGGVLPLVPPLNIDATGLLANAAAGNPITLQVLNTNGTVVGPADRCDLQADSYTLRAPAGIGIGGNRITGLGSTGLTASAGEANSIAFGNSASTDATATGALALGTGAAVRAGAVGGIALGNGALATGVNGVAIGAGSIAARGPLANYAALGLTGAQNAAGEVSVGAPGAERQVTNVAPGSAATDAVNVGQLAGVQAQIGTVAANAVSYDGASRDRVTLGGAAGTTIGNLAPGNVGTGSTEAVNGSQLFATNTNVTTLTTNVANGAIGAVQYSNAATPTVPNGGVPSNDVALVGAAAAPVGLHNLAAGSLAVGSTDAVNGGQLAGLGQSIATGLGGLSTYDPVANAVVPSIGIAGVRYTSVQAAFDAIDSAIMGGSGSPYFRVLSALPGATVSGTDSIAIGPQSNAAAANSVALGTGATAQRGASLGYFAPGLAGAQNSAGEVSVGAAGAERQITNVAAGVAATDAVNVGQLVGVAAQVQALGAGSVQYDNAGKTAITLAGAGGTSITNLTAGTVAAGSSDAVNGAQLFATNRQVTDNTTAITNLGDQVANGATGPVRYADAATPTTPNGGTRTNDVTLVGAAAAPVGLHNVANGSIAAGSTDAVNGGQVFALAATAVNAVAYDTNAAGARTNSVTLAGGNAASPVAVRNVAAGSVAAGSTDAVNGGQLYATNQAVTAAQSTADTALALGGNSVQYGTSRTSVTFNGGGAPTTLGNVAAGSAATDAVNVGQLNAGMAQTLSSANAYTDGRIAALNFDVRSVRRQGYAGSSAALAAAALPQPYEAGRGMVAVGGGTYGGQSAVAVGVAKAFNDGRTVMRLAGSYDSQGRVGASGGVGYQF